MPADPRRRRRHDPQLDLQKLRHRQRRPRRHRRPAPSAWTGSRRMTQEHPAREQLLLRLRQPLRDPDETTSPTSTSATTRIAGPILIFDGSGPGTGHGHHRQHPPRQQLHRRRQRLRDQLALQRHPGRHLRRHRQERRPRLHSTSTTTSTSPAGSAAINAGDPTNYPNRDIDGQTRPTGTAPDAGADEAG